MEKLVAIVLMAGLSTRFGSGKNKQLTLLHGKPVFSYSIETFVNEKHISEIVITINKDNENEIAEYIKSHKINAKLVYGGATRQESVENALKVLDLDENDIVIIHDGARPLVNNKVIEEVSNAANEFGAATAYLEVTDTIAMKNERDEISSFIDRTILAQIQTPQAFKYGLLKEAHKKANDEFATDDCTLIARLGHKVKLVKGDKLFHKVTTKEDILYLEGLLK